MISKIDSEVRVEPFAPTKGSKVNFGAAVTNVDLENLTGKVLTHVCIVK